MRFIVVKIKRSPKPKASVTEVVYMGDCQGTAEAAANWAIMEEHHIWDEVEVNGRGMCIGAQRQFHRGIVEVVQIIDLGQ